mmetsp:Transcript_4776/g.8162  ORF Transcript_4776/g.8162 Transcript_4776/m.8162 type:complete len:204 (+) Transcript_4776:1010-1621(+)
MSMGKYSAGPLKPTPAQFTIPHRPPHAFVAGPSASTRLRVKASAARTLSSLVTSSFTKWRFSGLTLHCAFSLLSESSKKHPAMTTYPTSARRAAVQNPMPLSQPVTKTAPSTFCGGRTSHVKFGTLNTVRKNRRPTRKSDTGNDSGIGKKVQDTANTKSLQSQLKKNDAVRKTQASGRARPGPNNDVRIPPPIAKSTKVIVEF